MKGRITCPKCGQDFIAQARKDTIETGVLCPHCHHHFTVKTTNDNMAETTKDDAECSWEEHGEPRKTILSSMKPRTDKPMLAAILLFIVVIIGVFSAVFPQQFIQTPITVLSAAGIQENILITVQDTQGNYMQNITISTSPSKQNNTNVQGKAQLNQLSVGPQTLTLANNNSQTTVDITVAPFDTSSYTIILNESSFQASIDDSSSDLTWISGILIILSIVTFMGVISSIRRRHSDVAIVGSIIGIFTIGFFLLGSLLSIIAFVFILKSKEEFDDGKKGKNF
ncbi:MAG: hypothetical protein R6U21_01280 [Thermoplasmatota archaeon]